MDGINSKLSDRHYYSEQLKMKLIMILSSSATVIEAPSGYGKTTAVRDILQTELTSPVHWLTAVDEPPTSGFCRFCEEIEKIDSNAGQLLRKIGVPNAATAGEACDIVRSIKCSTKTFFVFDNFQYIQNALPPSFCAALIANDTESLHVVLITQILRRDIHTLIAGIGFLHITAADLRLRERDICSYFMLSNLKITIEDAKWVLSYTEGWIIAVYLQMCSMRDTGELTQTAILRLAERLVWDVLTEEQQLFLMRVSLFESFCLPQACILAGCDVLPEHALQTLEKPLIRYNEATRRYELHSLLLDLLSSKRKEHGAAFNSDCLLRAGDYCCGERKTAEAVGFYIQAKNYDRILTLDFSEIMLEDLGDRRFPDIAMQIARECPASVQEKHPLSMLRIAWAVLLAGEKKLFCSLMAQLRPLLETNENAKLTGEWTLLHSYEAYPDLGTMTQILEQAEIQLGGECSHIILPSAPWCFGELNPLRVFHVTPGEADREADALDAYLCIYTKLTSGHGSGGSALFRALLASYRSDMNSAEILAYKAAYLAESNQQGIVLIGAAYLLAGIALQNADSAGWQNAVASIEHAALFEGQNNFVTRAVADITRAFLFNQMENHERDAEWIKNGELNSKFILPAMFNSALITHLGYLLRQGKYAQLLGMAQAVMSEYNMNNPLCLIVVCFMSAICHQTLGNNDEARSAVKRAMEAALPDGLIEPLAAYSWLLNGLVEQILQKEYPHTYEQFVAVRERFGAGWETLFNDMFRDGPPAGLTEREYEIAKLAAEGKRNNEIADLLFVSESTVRTHLRTVFQKLEVDRRAKLVEKLR